MACAERVCFLLLLSLSALSGVAESLRIAQPVTCKGQDGQRHKLGEKYTYGCMTCECTEKGELCASPRCIAIACDNYFTKGPGCCPICSEEPTTCKGQDGQLHKVGESYEYGCMHCHCSEEGEVCAMPMCAAVWCDNQISVGPGCCPTCPEEQFTCKGQDGQLHKVGEKYEYGCMTCECTEKGEQCYSPRCAPITCEDFTSDGPGCCPVCPEEPFLCKGQDGLLHKVGDVYQYGCMPCHCTENGEECFPLPCAPPPCANPVSEGPGCCPICQEGSDCIDPHTGMTVPAGQSVQNSLGMTCECSGSGEAMCYYVDDLFTTTEADTTTTTEMTTTHPTTTTPPAGCFVEGQYYAPGDSFSMSEPCAHYCVCHGYGQGYECYPPPCTVPPCPNPVHNGYCCSTCPNGPACSGLQGDEIPEGETRTYADGTQCYCGDVSYNGYHNGFMCTIISTTTVTSTTIIESTAPPPMPPTTPGGCYVEGNFYENGQSFSMTEPCGMGCRCSNNEQGYECLPLPCTMPPCPNPVPNGYCCSTCPNGPACSGLNGDEIPMGQTRTYADGTQCHCGDIYSGFMCTIISTTPMPPSPVA